MHKNAYKLMHKYYPKSHHSDIKSRVDHSKAFLCTTCGWGFLVLGLFTFKGLIKASL